MWEIELQPFLPKPHFKGPASLWLRMLNPKFPVAKCKPTWTDKLGLAEAVGAL